MWYPRPTKSRGMKICLTTDCGNMTEGSTDFCGTCNRRHRAKAKERLKAQQAFEDKVNKPQAKRLPIKKVSDKRKTENELYSRLREEYLKLNPTCEMKVNEICTKEATTIHHAKGRGILLNETKYWLSACMSCHEYVHKHPLEALKKGFSISRLATNNTI